MVTNVITVNRKTDSETGIGDGGPSSSGQSPQGISLDWRVTHAAYTPCHSKARRLTHRRRYGADVG